MPTRQSSAVSTWRRSSGGGADSWSLDFLGYPTHQTGLSARLRTSRRQHTLKGERMHVGSRGRALEIPLLARGWTGECVSRFTPFAPFTPEAPEAPGDG